MDSGSGFSVSDDGVSVPSVVNFLSMAVLLTRERMATLGIQENDLLDPVSDVDQQIAKLRLLFLEAEQTSLPFQNNGDTFWRIIRARLQPIVLAYLTHTKFLRTLDLEARSLNPDTLLQVYKERLSNSDQFRSFFFDLNERIKKEAMNDAESDSHNNLLPMQNKSTDAVASDESMDMQKNIIKSLEKKLKELEKNNNRQEIELKKSQEQIFSLRSLIEDKEEANSRLSRRIKAMEADALQYKVAADAARRMNSRNDIPTKIFPNEKKATLSDVVLDVDQQQLLMKIESIERELESTANAAYNAFVDNSDMGVVMLFMLSSFKCRSMEQLAKEMIKSLSVFELNVSVGVRSSEEFLFFNGPRVNDSVQYHLKKNLGSTQPIEHPYLLYFEENVCVGVENPPKKEVERYDRIKNNIVTLIRGAEARYGALLVEQSVQQQQKKVDALILKSDEVFKSFELNLAKKQVKIAQVINEFSQDVRRDLQFSPGGESSIRLNMQVKQLEKSVRGLFQHSELVDSAFKRNVQKIAESILKRKSTEMK